MKDIVTASGSSNPQYLTNVNGTLFFSATDSTNGTELWKSDGTEAGTVIVKDIVTASGSSYPYFLTDVNGTLFFIATDSTNRTVLWKSDGTAAGTVMVTNIVNPGDSDPYNLTNVNGTLFFVVYHPTYGRELFKSDGTQAGTVLVKDIVSGTGSSDPYNLANINDTLYFVASDTANGTELWKSDGTDAGTVLVKDIVPGSDSSSPEYLTNVNNNFLFFTATTPSQGNELYALSIGATSDTTPPVTGAAPSEGTYQTPQSITLTCSDTGGSGCVGIYYTLDGSVPTTASYLYNTPIPITYSQTLKFFSLDMAGNTEVIKTEIYTVDTIAPTTTASPPAGTYTTPQSVSLSCSDASGSGCAVIYYTTDGITTPGIGSPAYVAPISITEATTLKFMARDNAGNSENYQTLEYIFGYTISFSFTGRGSMTCAPTPVPSGGTFECTLSPDSGYHLESLFDNAADVTAQVSGTHYTVTNVTTGHTLHATFQPDLTVLRLYGTNNEAWYPLIQDAYDAASSGDDILALSTDFTEDLQFDQPVSIALQGGCSLDFYTITGWTVLNGKLTISDGTVIIENLIIK